MSLHVDIREVSLRDGLQIESPIPLSAKLELLAAVAATARILGDRRLEDRLADRIVRLAAVSGLGGAHATALRDPRVRMLAPEQTGPPPPGRQRTLRRPPSFSLTAGKAWEAGWASCRAPR